MVNRLVASVVVCLLLASTHTTRADEPGPLPPEPTTPAAPAPVVDPGAKPPAPSIQVFHLPQASLEAGEELLITASITPEQLVTRAWVDLQPAEIAIDHPVFAGLEDDCREAGATYLPESHTCRFELLREERPGVFAVSVPGTLVQPPGVTYSLSFEARDGHTEVAFGQAGEVARPHPVIVTGETPASRRADRLARHRGRTSQVSLRTEGTAFGEVDLSSRAWQLKDPSGSSSERFSDRYFSVEAEYTSRPLSTVYAFSLGLGFMRGQRARYEMTNGGTRSLGEGPQPGLNYGYGSIAFELDPIVYLTPRITLGASEAGFAAGFGAELRIGRMAATNLSVGFDAISGLGTRGWLTFAWHTVPGFPMGLTVELTDWPNSDTNDLASRLLYDLGIELSDFVLGLRLGYAQRSTSYEGGFVVGLGGTYDF